MEAFLEILLLFQSSCWDVSGLQLSFELSNSEGSDTALLLLLFLQLAIPQDTNQIQVVQNLVQCISFSTKIIQWLHQNFCKILNVT